MKNKKKLWGWIFRVLLGAAVLCAALFFLFAVLQRAGKNQLYDKRNEVKPTLESMELPEAAEAENWQEGDIRYRGDIYRYNEEMLNFLLLGIDESGEVVRKKDGIKGGQSDALFLVCINPRTKKISVIGINRDTMADVDIYTQDGIFLATTKAQITLQHGYGDGAELSCERSVRSVERLFYNIPIHGYFSLNMGGISQLNDAVGGVEVIPEESFSNSVGIRFTKGEKILLKGNMVDAFLRYRDHEVLGSAGDRLSRQQQYLGAYAKKAVEAFQKNPALAVSLYQTLSKYMVTNISLEELTYLATQISRYQFSKENIYSLQGETVMGEKHEEFYPDEEAFYDLIIEVFYEKVTE